MSIYSIFLFFYFLKIGFCLNTCKENINFCTHCNILTKLCAKCEKPEILIPDEKGGCKGANKCISGKHFCNECNDEGTLCKICEKNYYPDDNGGCTYSEGCEISYMGECLKCKDGFILIGKENELRICRSILIDNFKNCKEINYEIGSCKLCDDGYYLTSSDHKCIKENNCKESLFGNCISCNNGYYYDKQENKCKLKDYDFLYCQQTINSKDCDTCDDGYFLDENNICVQTPFCSKSSNLKCEKCVSDYILADNLVCTTTNNCSIGSQFTSLCSICQDGYYLDKKDFKCKSNLEENSPLKHCHVVENNECIQCEYGYYLGEDAKCTNTKQCAESENGKCLTCSKDYYLGLDNKCTNVERCIYSNYDVCTECEEGYYYDKLNKTCLEITQQFLNCKSSCYDNNNKCCECKDNFYLFQNDSLCYDNTKDQKFAKCIYVDLLGDKCSRCAEGYYLGKEDSKCCKVKNCKIVKDENTCLECEELFCLDVKKQLCVDNDNLHDINDKKYISCNKTNEEGTACEQCINGYEINENGLCNDIDICEEKKDGKCLKCKEGVGENGYFYCANEIFGCLENSGEEGCLRCDNLTDLYECTEYKEGYNKTNNEL